MVLDKEYYKKINESERKFYGIINEIRIQMGMPTVEVPFYGPKESDAIVESNGDVTRFDRSGSVDAQYKNDTPVHLHFEASDSQPKTIEENLKTMKMLAQRIQQVDFSTQPSSAESFICDEEQHLQETSGLINFGLFPNLSSGIVEIVDSEPTLYPFKTRELQSFLVEEDTTKISLCDSIGNQYKTEFQQQTDSRETRVESTPSLSNIGVLETELEKEGRRVLSPSTEMQNSDIQEGNEENSEFKFLVLDVNDFKNGVRNCDEWEFHDLVGHLGIVNHDLQPLLPTGNVGSLDFEFMMNAQEVFVKMSKKECADFELPSTVEDAFGSIDSIRSFMFDPGKSNVFVRNFDSEGVHILVFDPGGDQVLLIVWALSIGNGCCENGFMCCGYIWGRFQ